jgi:hypothetical protein
MRRFLSYEPVWKLWRRRKKLNGTRNLDCAVRSNIASAPPAISTAEYFLKFLKRSQDEIKK